MKKINKWSQKVTQNSHAMDLEEGVFTWQNPRHIALSLAKSALQSNNLKATPFGSAMSMLNFYINRAGKKLDVKQKTILVTAKEELRKFFKEDKKIAIHSIDKITPNVPEELITKLIKKNLYFPNNSLLPLLIYRQTLVLKNKSPIQVKRFLAKNNWKKAWKDGVYDYHHYHSNTHEVLIIFEGHCRVQFGGPNGTIYKVSKGDVIILPAGMAHKKLAASKTFKCIGAYPFNIEYDMNYGVAEEHPEVDENIKKLALPEADPIFGKNGLIFEYWKKT